MKLATLLAAGTIALSLLIHWPTMASMVAIRAESNAYSHAYTVAISYAYDDERRIAEDVLRSYVEDNFAVIEQCMAMDEPSCSY